MKTAESQIAIKCFLKNKMIVNPDRFKSVIQKSNQTSKSKQFLIRNKIVEVASSI